MSAVISSLIIFKSQYFKTIITFCVLSFGIKIAGNYVTKVGDIVADFKNKILTDKGEDNDTTKFDYIDNIGDVIGDMFGNIIDLSSLGLLILGISQSDNINDAMIYLFVAMGEVLSFILIWTGLSIVLPNFMNKMLKHIDLCFVLNIIAWSLFHGWQRTVKLYGVNSIYLSCISKDYYYTLFFASIILCHYILTGAGLYRSIYNNSKKFAEGLGTYSIIFVGCISLIITYCIIYVIYFAIAIFKNELIFSSYYMLTGNVLFRLFMSFASYQVFKTTIGVFADSICGVYKKIILEDEDIKKSKTCQSTIVDVENQLDLLDSYGNKFKMDTKTFINSVLLAIVVSNSALYQYSFFTYIVASLLVLSFFLVWYRTSILDIKNISYSQLYRIIFIHAYYFFWIVVVVLFRVTNHTMLNPKGLLFHIAMETVFLSLFGAISGSIMDMNKKTYKEVTPKIEFNKETYKTFVKIDLIGDFLKDVFSPTFYTIGFISILLFHN